jgi:predicted N-acetyltransferase YhbS
VVDFWVLKVQATKMNFRFYSEILIPRETRRELQKLLAECFPDFLSERTYYKQLPHGRLLATIGGRIVGQIGFDYRAVRSGKSVLQVVGIVDVCVDAGFRRRGVAEAMLMQLEKLVENGDADALVALADDPRLFIALGYHQVDPAIRWFSIEDRRSVDLVERRLGGVMLVKPIREAAKAVDLQVSLDFLGHLY